MRVVAVFLFILAAMVSYGALPSYEAFLGTNGIRIISNPPLGKIIIDGSGVSLNSTNQPAVAPGTNATVTTNIVGGKTVYTVSSTATGSGSGSDTNGLATTNYVNGATNTVSVNQTTAINSASNSLLNQILTTQTGDITVSNIAALADSVGALTNNASGQVGWFPSFVTATVTNGLANTNFVNSTITTTSNYFETAKQPASSTLTNIANTGAITNVSDAANAGISLIYTSNNFTIKLATFSAGAAVWITNNGTNIVIAGQSTNGFVTQTITNGLATISYVNGATNGLVTASVTNGLATISYVDTSLNNASNSLRSTIVSSEVWTNDGVAIRPNQDPTNSLMVFNHGIYVGTNTYKWNGGYRNEAFVSYRNADVENDNNDWFIETDQGANLAFMDLNIRPDNSYMRIDNISSETTEWLIDMQTASNPSLSYGIGTARFLFKPAAPDNGTVPYIFDSRTKTSGNLLEVKNNGTTKFSVGYSGVVNPVINGFITTNGTLAFQDLDTPSIITLLQPDGDGGVRIMDQFGLMCFDVNDEGETFLGSPLAAPFFPALNITSVPFINGDGRIASIPDAASRSFLFSDAAGTIAWSTLPITNLASYPNHTALTNGDNNIKTISVNASGGGSLTDQGTNVQINIPSTNGLVDANFATNKVRVAPGAGTTITTNYADGGVTYVVADTEVSSPMVLTNFVINQVYTNTSTQPILVIASAYLTPALANGDCSLDLMYSQTGGTGYALLSRVAIDTLLTGGITLPITNVISGVITNLGSYYFTNTSSGVGNSAGLVGAGTGQYTVMGGGAQGATGAQGGFGSSLQTNAFGGNVGGATNLVLLPSTNITVSATNTSAGGGTNSVKIDTIQPISTQSSPTFSNQTITGTSSLAAIQQTGDANGNGKSITNSYNLIEVLARSNAFYSISNTVTETTLASYTIKPFEIGTNHTITLSCAGDMVQNTGTSTNLTNRVYVGGVNVWSGLFSMPNGTARRPFDFTVSLTMCDSATTNSEYFDGSLRINGANANPISGAGSYGTITADAEIGSGATLISVSMITNTEFYITSQFAGAGVSSVDRKRFWVEKR